MRRRHAFAALAQGVAAVLAAPSARVAASPAAPSPSPSPGPPGPLTFEADVDVVSLTAVVFDKAGRFATGLGKADVEVLEDGVKQQLLHFREVAGKEGERIPLSVALVLDASGSMKESLPFLQEAAISFLGQFEDGDQAVIIDFSNGVRSSADFTADVDRLEQFVDALQAWGGTSLNDALHYALGRVRDRPGRKAIVVFSDGADTTSTLGEGEVVDYARAVEATVYTIGFEGRGAGASAKGFLKRVAAETGGAFFAPDAVGDLRKVFGAISKELHSHYALAYTPQRPPDGSFRRLEVRVLRRDLQVRVRKGYFAARRRR